MSAGAIRGRRFPTCSELSACDERRVNRGQTVRRARESAAMTVRVDDRGDGVVVVTIDRPEVRNAVDGPTAAALAEEFRRFDADDELAVAVLTGSGRTLCAG